jgi:hypothetical protein
MVETKARCPNPACGREYRVKPESLGKTATCKGCGQTFVLAAAAPQGAHQPAARSIPVPQPHVGPLHEAQPVGGTAVIAPVAAPHRTEQGHQVGAPVINIAPPRRGSSLGVASLVLGILAFLICWIPFVNLLGVPLAGLGLLLGVIGFVVALTRKGASIGYPIAGSAICGLALFVAISVTGVLVAGLKKVDDEIVAQSGRRNATNQTTVAPVVSPPRAEKPPTQGNPTPPAAEPGNTKATQRPAPERPSTPESEWASADTPVRQGDVQVKVKSVKVGQVPLKDLMDGGEGRSEDALLSIQLEVKNLSETKKVDYRTWGGGSVFFGTRIGLTDNFDNRYKLVNFGFGSEVVGAVESESVYPGKSITDVIVFEKPIEKVEFLNLELPAEQFGGSGMLRIRIPASMIRR